MSFVGFPVKCAEADWLLEVSFALASKIRIVPLVTGIACLGIQNGSFGEPGASTLVPCGPFLAACGRPEGPSDQQEGHVGVQNHMFSIFGTSF